MLPFLIITSVLAQAEEPERIILRSVPPPAEETRINGLRLGICAGFSTECLVSSPKVEYAWRRVAINFHLPVLPLWGGANLKLYSVDIREGERRSWRPYAYGGWGGLCLMVVFTASGSGPMFTIRIPALGSFSHPSG